MKFLVCLCFKLMISSVTSYQLIETNHRNSTPDDSANDVFMSQDYTSAPINQNILPETDTMYGLLQYNSAGDGGDDSMLLEAFAICLLILVLSLLGVLGVIVLFYRMDRRRRNLLAVKSAVAAITVINHGKQHPPV